LDNSFGIADKKTQFGGIRLSIQIPEINEIKADAQILPRRISKEEF
jgi:hypothetical protein